MTVGANEHGTKADMALDGQRLENVEGFIYLAISKAQQKRGDKKDNLIN